MSTEPDIEKLREFYRSFQCHGVVALINFLVSPSGQDTVQIGSGTLGLKEIMEEIWVDKDAQLASAWFRTKSLYIGSRDGSTTPLQWLEQFAPLLESAPLRARTKFDNLCRTFALVSQAKPVGDVEIISSHGHFIIPADQYNPDHELSDAELEPYRVPFGKRDIH